MRIVIAGAGEVGTHLARLLSNENHEIVLIDIEEHRVKPIDPSLDVLVYRGSATSAEMLKTTIGDKTNLFIAVTPSEDTNITSSILAKNLGAVKTIARINNMEYLEPGTRELFKNMGVDSLIYPELIATREVLGLLHETGTTEFMDFCGGKLSLYVQKLDENTPFLNKSLKDLESTLKTEKYRVVAIKRNETTIIPRGNEQLCKGDLIFMISTQEGIKDIMSFSGKKNFKAKSIMILGGSPIGKHIATFMQKECEVKLIDSSLENCQALAEILENTLIINGDGRNVDLLTEEGLANMDAFVAVTGKSETNIMACLLAKGLGVKRTIAEVENMEYINLAENIGIDNIINKKIAAASRIFRHTANPNVTQVKFMAGINAEVLEFNVTANASITEGPLYDLRFPKDAIVGGGIRDGIPFIATGETRIKVNDKVVVFSLPSALDKLSKFFD
jgi:trk system potassium uptake protein TrkA